MGRDARHRVSISRVVNGFLLNGNGLETGRLNLNTFFCLFFTLFLFPEGKMVGKRAVKSGFILSSLSLSDPTLQIYGVLMTTLPPIHPGEILKEEFLEPFGMSQQQLAESLNVSRQQISNIIQGKQAITAEMALRLGRYFGLSAKFWLNLQSHYDLDVAEEALSKRLAQEIKPYVAICDPVITRSAIINYQ